MSWVSWVLRLVVFEWREKVFSVDVALILLLGCRGSCWWRCVLLRLVGGWVFCEIPNCLWYFDVRHDAVAGDDGSWGLVMVSFSWWNVSLVVDGMSLRWLLVFLWWVSLVMFGDEWRMDASPQWRSVTDDGLNASPWWRMIEFLWWLMKCLFGGWLNVSSVMGFLWSGDGFLFGGDDSSLTWWWISLDSDYFSLTGWWIFFRWWRLFFDVVMDFFR